MIQRFTCTCVTLIKHIHDVSISILRCIIWSDYGALVLITVQGIRSKAMFASRSKTTPIFSPVFMSLFHSIVSIIDFPMMYIMTQPKRGDYLVWLCFFLTLLMAGA
ncbi:hypothetical protein F4808DRAFT_407900 [Astrocystis sublimbata]|nr:hypothetical protein F4808DRAFT_407900 [Astrocystis sublimbata]